MREVFKSPLGELSEYAQAEDHLKKGGSVWLTGCTDSQKVHVLQQLKALSGWQLVVTYDEIRAKEIYGDYRLFAEEVHLFPAKDVMFFSADIKGNYLTQNRMNVLRHVMEAKEGIIVTTIDGLMNLLPPLSVFLETMVEIDNSSVIEQKALAAKLVEMGYTREAMVTEPGQFAIRGDIIDLYCVTEENPIRIELWGDEIDAMRYFDAESQRSIEQVEAFTIFPAVECYVTEKRKQEGLEKIHKSLKKQLNVLTRRENPEAAHRLRLDVEEFLSAVEEYGDLSKIEYYMPFFYGETCTLLDYLPENTIICLDEPDRLKAKAQAVEEELKESFSQRLEKGYLLPEQTAIFCPMKTVFAAISGHKSVIISNLDYKASYLSPANLNKYAIDAQPIAAYKDDFEYLIKDLNRYRKDGWRVVILSPSRTRGMRQAEALREYGLMANYSEQGIDVMKGEILVTYGNLHRGFAYPLIRFAVLTESDLKSEKRKYKPKQKYQGSKISDFSQLTVGDYVVHEDYGLGIYQGIINKKVDDEPRDYISILYGDGGTLFIPATKFHLIQKYASATTDQKPKLSRLGTQEWHHTKERVRKAVETVAQDLVELYAKRMNGNGFSYGPDTVWQREFEEMFPYEETRDQLQAIADTKNDMESGKIMDRLICGDVGYGKTEVAIRAAFKAVMDNKQVVVLCPTTILAQQHYNTFVQRMKDFPVKVALMSRFRTAKEIRTTIADLKKGMVDIVIGTHRVLSDDVEFKNLGLLIVDEEQRFGVTHKEKIKKLRYNIDVLTMTATPIPRTLHMSMIGVRDMSVLEEAPGERVPIQTYVMEQNPELVREAINRELSRGGQVYFVHNKVKNIEEIASEVQKLVPDANVAYAHGQMEERRLETLMLDFINGEIDVLVTTTIIETGLDISNVNTIIINDADRFGLSQLYQLRGRVGRSNRTAYAFILYRRDKILTEVAEKRLAAIREFSELGSGIKIAMSDLEMRGAGSILGRQQHGNVEAVGYDLYVKMLSEAVRNLKNDLPANDGLEYDTTVDLRISAYIPPKYIPNENQKMDIYKRIASVETEEDLSDMRDELIDRYGEMPASVDNLLQISALRALAHSAMVTQITGGYGELRIVMFAKANVNMDRLLALLKQYEGRLNMKADGDQPTFVYSTMRGGHRDTENVTEILKVLLNHIKMLLD